MYLRVTFWLNCTEKSCFKMSVCRSFDGSFLQPVETVKKFIPSMQFCCAFTRIGWSLFQSLNLEFVRRCTQSKKMPVVKRLTSKFSGNTFSQWTRWILHITQTHLFNLVNKRLFFLVCDLLPLQSIFLLIELFTSLQFFWRSDFSGHLRFLDIFGCWTMV